MAKTWLAKFLQIRTLHWLLTLIPTLWLSTIFLASLRGKALIGYLPTRHVAMSDADITALNQDAVFQFFVEMIDVVFGVMALALLIWPLITLAILFKRFQTLRKQQTLPSALWQTARYGLLHGLIVVLPIVLFVIEPTHRADWLFD